MILEEAVQLKLLDLSSSPLIQRLDLQAPNLTHLNLGGCRRLDGCRIQCPNLEYVNVRGARTWALRFCKNVRQVLVKSWCESNGACQYST